MFLIPLSFHRIDFWLFFISKYKYSVTDNGFPTHQEVLQLLGLGNEGSVNKSAN